MATTSVKVDRDLLTQARQLSGTSSNRETVELALRTLVAIRRQPDSVEQIIGRRFGDATDSSES